MFNSYNNNFCLLIKLGVVYLWYINLEGDFTINETK